ncbi:MAG: TetR/AcrR family transcriptional regulator [Lactobacillus sp.]
MDIRIANTKNRIQAGLIKAIEEEPLYKIKDKDVIANAQVSAASFYKYYSDKSKVLTDLEDELMAKFKKAVAIDIQNWQTVNHSPSKKDMNRMIDQNLNELIDFAIKNREYVSTLLSQNGDPGFQHRIVDYTSKIIERTIVYYYSIYNQQHILSQNNFKLKIISKQYALSFLGPLLIWEKNSDELTVKDIKSLIKIMVLKSPYDLSTHGL